MKIFKQNEIVEAIAYSKSGGQALHLHRFANPKTAPKCFVRAIASGEDIAHLLDQDRDRLITLAKSVGVKVLYIDKEGSDRQHIDVCGKPLEKLKLLFESKTP